MQKELILENVKTESDITKITFPKIIMIYIIGGVIGTLWETILHLVNHQSFEVRSGSFHTPINPVYGFGLVLIVLCLHKIKSNFNLFFCGAFLGGGAEYLLSFLQEKLLHTRSWDYSQRFLNINGRTTLPYCIIWGLGSLIIIRFLVPILVKLIDRMDPNTLKVMSIVFSVIIVFDLLSTVSGILRYSLRAEGIGAKTFIGQAIDYLFPDSRVLKYFPNMRKV